MAASIVDERRAKRTAMAKVFADSQAEMASAVDDLMLTRRSAVPFRSEVVLHSVRNPIPADAHLIPSKDVMPKQRLPNFEMDRSRSTIKASGKPWASYEKPSPDVTVQLPMNMTTLEPPPPPATAGLDEEMWRTQYQEWTLQKNAYNPDVAAAMRFASYPMLGVCHAPPHNPPRTRCRPKAVRAASRPQVAHLQRHHPCRTNVRKQAALSMVDPALSQDPARTSENVKAALADLEVTGPAPPIFKEKLQLRNVFPR
jgi:hypothetical protein